MKKLLFLAVALLTMVACTENQRARNFGGTMTISLKPGEKLMMATWKGEDLFYLTEPMDSDYTPKTKTLREDASFGVIQTVVVFEESR